MRQTARAAHQQRQAGGDHRVCGSLKTQDLREHDLEHRARLGIGGERQARGAVDQFVEVGAPAQNFAGNGAGERPVGVSIDPREGGTARLVERFAPPQHGIDKVERGTARGKAGNVHALPL